MSQITHKLNNPLFTEAVWWGVAIGAVGFSLLHGGQDWTTIYLPATEAGFTTAPKVGNPTYILLLFQPLSYLPPNVGGAIIVALSIISIWLTARLTNVNRWLILISYPSLWMIKMAQIDALVMLGVALGWWAIEHKKPYWQGVATLLLCLKPQIGGFLALIYLWWQRDYRAFVISGSVGLFSLLLYGPWIGLWFNKLLFAGELASQSEGDFISTGNSIGLFPYGLLFLAIPFIFSNIYSSQEQITAIITASMLAAPYAAYYSILSTMAFPLPFWIYGLISLPLIGPIGWASLFVFFIIIFHPIVRWLWQRYIS